MKRYRLTPDMLEDRKLRVDRWIILDLWKELISHTGDEMIGIKFGQEVTANTLGQLGQLTKYCATLDESFEHLFKFSALFADDTIIEGKRGKEICVVRIGSPLYLLAQPCSIQFRAAALISLIGEINGKALIPESIVFPRGSQLPVDSLEKAFSCECMLAGTETFIQFREKDLSDINAHAEPELAKVLQDHCESLLAIYAHQSNLVGRIYSIMTKHISAGQLSIKTVSAELGLSERGLQRQLDARGFSFTYLLSKFRRELAFSLLQNDELSIGEIATMVGYCDISAFNRAFKKWEGCTANQYRSAHYADSEVAGVK